MGLNQALYPTSQCEMSFCSCKKSLQAWNRRNKIFYKVQTTDNCLEEKPSEVLLATVVASASDKQGW